MVVCVPVRPRFATASERQVWELLCEQLRPQDVLYANLRITDDRKDHEADLVVLLPGAGVVVVEIKGGELWHNDESWWQRRSGEPVSVDPVGQARDAKYALRRYVESDPRWKARHRGRFRWAHAVVLPYTAIADDFALPDCPRWCVSGRDDLGDLAGRLWDVPVRQESANRVLDEDDAEALVAILRGRGLPQRDVVALAAEREQVTEQLTHDQAIILDAARLLRRVEVRGGAGSGKTWLALEQARRLTRAGERVALTCYSRGLAEYLRRTVATWPRKQRPTYVGEFHSSALSGAPRPVPTTTPTTGSSACPRRWSNSPRSSRRTGGSTPS